MITPYLNKYNISLVWIIGGVVMLDSSLSMFPDKHQLFVELREERKMKDIYFTE